VVQIWSRNTLDLRESETPVLHRVEPGWVNAPRRQAFHPFLNYRTVIDSTYEPQIRARLGTTAHFSKVVVLKLRDVPLVRTHPGSTRWRGCGGVTRFLGSRARACCLQPYTPHPTSNTLTPSHYTLHATHYTRGSLDGVERCS